MIIREKLEKITQQELEQEQHYSQAIRVCVAAGCLSSQSDRVKEALERAVDAQGYSHSCQVKGVGCLGLCSQGPLVAVRDGSDDVLYQNIQPDDANEIAAALAPDREPLERLICPTDTPFFQRQVKVVLENCGRIDPERIEEYIAAGGYEALVTAVNELQPSEIIDEVMTSGLRGRGGGGYPTGLKWATVAKAHGEQKYIICNADEGDPGAFMDRSVLESDPHRVLEGMALAAYAIGASRGYVYVRGEYPLAVERLTKAIRQAKRHGFLGTRICDSNFDFEIDIRLGAGAFVCGCCPA